MLTNLYQAILAIVGTPNNLSNTIGNMPAAVQVIHVMFYTVAALLVVMVISFVFKFLLKLVER